LVEDLINSGVSIGRSIEAVEELGGKVLSCFSIVSYGFYLPEGRDNNFVQALVSFEDLISYGSQHGLISVRGVELLRDWHSSPDDWRP
jgi:orotate phosphoribosyltransferase